jgi:SlyX protein
MEERLIELEIKFSNQENMLEQLSHVLFEQQKQIDQLERQIEELRQTKTMEIGPHNVKPPHY